MTQVQALQDAFLDLSYLAHFFNLATSQAFVVHNTILSLTSCLPVFPGIVLGVCPADVQAQTECGHLTFLLPMSPGRAQCPPIQTVATNQVDLGSHMEEA